MYRLNLSEHKDMLRPLLVIARNALHRVRSLPPTPNPAPGSHALLAFDPYITRRLHNFIPMRIIDLGSTETTWIQLGELLQSWEDLDRLLNSHSLSAWEVSLEFPSENVCFTFPDRRLGPCMVNQVQTSCPIHSVTLPGTFLLSLESSS